MPTPFVRCDLRVFAAGLFVLAAIAGCSGKPRRTVPTPVHSDRATQAAIQAGALALVDCRREHLQARLAGRPADFSRARGQLAEALVQLEPARLDPAKPQYERAAAGLAMSLEALDRIIAARGAGDADEEALGWDLFDRAVESLMLALAR
ncbi:hypothetical protein KJ612_16755 [Myxococcota bacterium]|nr:hypothetical protein [Myxococcota bacterium]